MSLHPGEPDPMLHGIVDMDDMELGDEIVVYRLPDGSFCTPPIEPKDLDLCDPIGGPRGHRIVPAIRFRLLVVCTDMVDLDYETAQIRGGYTADPRNTGLGCRFDENGMIAKPPPVVDILMRQLEKSVEQAKAARRTKNEDNHPA